MKRNLSLLVVLFFSLTSLVAQVNITFELNTATIQNIDPSGIYIGGGSGFGVPGDNQMTDPDGDGIYTITLQREVGFSSFYTFLNGNCSDWGCKENLAGLPCGDPANFNDRYLPPVNGDVTIMACFGTCDDDGSCTIVTDSVDITFELNTALITDIDPGGIFLAGGGNFGNPGDNPMVDPEGDGTYTITVRKPQGFQSYYTFTNGNCPDFNCKEDLDGLPCADPNAFNDRFLTPVNENTTIKACFGNCADNGSCIETGVNGLTIDNDLFSLQPNVVTDVLNISFGTKNSHQEKQIMIINTLGQILKNVATQNDNTYQLNTSRYPMGTYLVTIRTEETMLTKRFIVQ